MKRAVVALAALAAAAFVWSGAAQAQMDAFVISGTPIDATAANATIAREQAIAEGAPRALRRLMQRLVLAEDADRVPSVSAQQATALATGFQVSNELRSATRYRGDLTVSFDPEGVRRLLRNSGLPFLESAAPPTLVAPVYRVGGQASLWSANPWGEGWDISRYIGGFAPVVLPEAFGAMVDQVSAEAVANANMEALEALAGAYGVSRVLVAVAEPRGGELHVQLTLVRMGSEVDVNAPGGAPRSVTLSPVSVRAGESEAPFRLAADRAHDALADDWKQRTVVRSQSRSEMRLTVMYNGIGEWHSLRNALNASPFVTDRRLDAMSRDGAMMTLTYRGVREQLVSDLERRGAILRTDPQLGDVVRAGSMFSPLAGAGTQSGGL